jgi:hypothetical protein
LSDPARWRAVELPQPIPFYQGLQVYENLRALPRVWLAHRAEVRTEADQLRLIRGETSDNSGRAFDPTVAALITPEAAATLNASLLTGAALDVTTAPRPSGQATITSRTANTMTVFVDTDGPAILMMSEVAFPGWLARVDGQAVELLRADYLLRGVMVPAGKHHVEMRYAAPAARIGVIITLLTLLAMAGSAIFWRIRK